MAWIVLSLAAIVAFPLATLGFELLLALLARTPRAPVSVGERVACAVLMPAHNEAGGIDKAVRNLKSQMRPGDRAIVIADNCTDKTAAIARAAGAEVLERFDDERRGKGYALDCGVMHLDAAPPPIVVVLDADCEIHPGTLDTIVSDAHRYNAPVQSVYLMEESPEASPKEQISAFALLVKNLVRPLGLHQIGMPCLLTGTGMAFPWALFRGAEHGTGNIVEDMKLGVDLCIAGHYPRLAPTALVTTEPAPSPDAAAKQRTRWEHGHVRTLFTQAPRLVAAGIRQGRLRPIGAAAELAVPPVSLLLMVWAICLAGCTVWWQLPPGTLAPLLVCVAAILPIFLFLPLVWMKFGRRTVRGRMLLKLPIYMIWKLPIYLKLVTAPQKELGADGPARSLTVDEVRLLLRNIRIA